MASETATNVDPKEVPIPRWVVKSVWRFHRFLYRVSRGRFGLRAPTADKYGMMQLRTVGRKTGLERSVILAYFEDGPDLIVVPMNGWADPEPAWWLNLQAQPDAMVDLPDGPRQVRARLADPDERARLWKIASEGTWGPEMDNFAAGRNRKTEIVILEPR